MASSLPEGEKAAHWIRLPSLPCRLEMSALISVRWLSSGWMSIGRPDCVQVVMQIRFSSPPGPEPERKMEDVIPLSSDSCSGTRYLQVDSSWKDMKGNLQA